jgi:hypothetical protein
MRIEGTLTKINNYKQLIIKIDQTYEQVKAIRPGSTWAFKNCHYVRVSLDREDKALLKSKFEPFVHRRCVMTIEPKEFESIQEGKVQYLQLLTFFGHQQESQQ